MKKIEFAFTIILGLLTVLFVTHCDNAQLKNIAAPEFPPADTSDATNYFYDNAATVSLAVSGLTVDGEIENPGTVDFSSLQKHSVIVKEAILDGASDAFVGAYRYDGYSLIDILNLRRLSKANAEAFEPIIDLYVEISNKQGEKVVISWGEIFYPNHLHEIIIATDVMRIVPSKTNELWPLPTESKLIVSTDLITERNISSPDKITVRSYPGHFEVDRNIEPFYAPEFTVYINETEHSVIESNPEVLPLLDYKTVFYGRGRGIHKSKGFTGFMLKDLFSAELPLTQKDLRTGLFVLAALDGYRAVFTYSEVMNRNDQAEVLVCQTPEDMNGGKFRVFPAGDFFSDRAVKALTSVHYQSE